MLKTDTFSNTAWHIVLFIQFMAIDTPYKIHDFIAKHISLEVEEVWVLALNAQLKLNAYEMIFRGTLTSVQIHPREVLRFALRHNSASYILIHSHPSGDSRPSAADRQVTRKLRKVSQWMEIPMNDHVIIAKGNFYSFALKSRYQWAPEQY